MAKYKRTKGQNKKSLLADEYPMLVYPALAHRIGPDAAMVLQQLNFWLNNFELAGNETMNREGRWWVFNTVSDWQAKQFTWWSVRKVEVILQDLEKMGLITTKKFYSYKWDQKKWYSVNYDAVLMLADLDIAFLDWKMPDLVKYLAQVLGGQKSLKPSKTASNIICGIEGTDYGLSRTQNMVDDLKETKKIDKSKRLKHIDSVSGETTGSNVLEGLEESKKEEAMPTGSVSNQKENPDNCGADENDSHSQNSKPEPPIKNWNLSVPVGVDSQGYIQFPSMKNIDPRIKHEVSQVLWKVYREAQFHVVEEWIDDERIEIYEDEEAGETMITDKDGDWTEEEAFGKNGQLPLRLLRNIAASDPYNGFSVDAYNRFIIDRFNYHWNRL